MILVVDDDDDVRDVLAESLELGGHDVLQAANGCGALALLDDHPGVSLIVTDIRMPGLSGVQLAQRAWERRRDLRIILISGYFQPQELPARFLKKPFSLGEFGAAVQAELKAGPRP